MSIAEKKRCAGYKSITVYHLLKITLQKVSKRMDRTSKNKYDKLKIVSQIKGAKKDGRNKADKL